MPSQAMFAEIAALSGDPARASMLHALMDGRALTATELARAAGVTPQTASGHLSRMTAVGLLSVERQGRHRYHRLATASVARMLESIMQVAADLAPDRSHLSVGPRDAAMRKARTCYDHLAGQLGVALADSLIARGHVELAGDAGVLTDAGMAFLAGIGLDTAPLLARRTARSGRVLCRPCLDWSERRPHLAGALGAAICAHSLDQGWTRRLDATRAVLITPKGARIFRDTFGATIG
ncbi:ArsR/SmtB family transcription factor [Rhodopseudomonas sp. RCAM05734]|uniref:ArsR/SmtB family transcription factor n=1 Tax=Rhodopseudomonas sp. RCAM05734 TaxID=3457549 RepID=UPI0040446D60